MVNDIQYIMVTNWADHWSKFIGPDKRDAGTFFTLNMTHHPVLKKGPWFAKARTLFITLNEKKQCTKCWIGYSRDFKTHKYNENPAIRFEIEGLEEVDCPPEFKSYPIGWHLNEANSHALNQPLFFSYMKTCAWQKFEEYSFQLLRLLGIHDVLKFPQNDNKGKSDGFFVFNTLAVLYDVTLDDNFKATKKTQIDNYVNLLRKDKIKQGKREYSFHEKNREVWIINRGPQVKLLKTVDDIKVKEIPYHRLIDIYYTRLSKEIDTRELCDLLKGLA